MTNVSKHCFITGDVQGVFYRSNTQKQAKKLGLVGWVKNLDDGRVEAFVSGEEGQVQELITWMHKGPSYSSVEKVEVIEEIYKEFDGFNVVY